MSKLVFLVVCVAVFQIANALECYHCDKDQCEQDMKSWSKTNCGKSVDPKQTAACLKYVFKDKGSQKESVSRKCVFVNKNENYKCTPSTGSVGEEVFCSTCDTELCNSAPSVNLSFVAVSGIVLAMIIPKFLA